MSCVTKRWLRTGGYVKAMYNLAVKYERGRGTAAKQGYAKAQLEMGNRYCAGKNVAEDKIRALLNGKKGNNTQSLISLSKL